MKNIYFMRLAFLVYALSLFFPYLVWTTVIDSRTINSDITNSANHNIVELAESTPDLSTFVQLMNAAGLASELEGTGPLTVFAPSNEAFAALQQNTLQNLMKKENKTMLATLLKNHIVKGSLLTNQINSSNIRAIGGKPLHIDVHGSQITVNDAHIVQSDLIGTNGVIQIIDAVLYTQ